MPAAERQSVESSEGAKLAATTSDDVRVQRLIRESFVGAYGVVLWIAAGLSVASSLSAACWLVEPMPEPRRRFAMRLRSG